MHRYLFLSFASLTLLLAACGGGTPPPPSSITLTVEDPEEKFIAAAYQVGTGDWQTLNMSGTTTKTATIQMNNQTKYGVAVRCSSDPVSPVLGGVKVIQATSTELANPRIVCSRANTVPFTVDVNISGIPVSDGDRVCVNGWPCSQPLAQGATLATVTADLIPGTRDLLVTLKNSSDLAKVAKVVKGVSVTNGGNTTVSLGSGDVKDPVSFTVPNPPSGYPSSSASVTYLSADGTASGSLNFSPTSYRPVSGFGGGDLYRASAEAYGPNGFNDDRLVSLQLFNSGAPNNLAFPDPWPSGNLTVTQTDHPKVSGLTRSESDLQGYAILMSYQYTAVLSKAWLGSDTSYTLPDLSSLLGYTPPQNGTSVDFSVFALLSNKIALVTDFAINNTITDPSGLEAGDYIKTAGADTDSFTVGGGNLTLP